MGEGNSVDSSEQAGTPRPSAKSMGGKYTPVQPERKRERTGQRERQAWRPVCPENSQRASPFTAQMNAVPRSARRLPAVTYLCHIYGLCGSSQRGSRALFAVEGHRLSQSPLRVRLANRQF
jgi:hypothetical protein